jgi:cation transport ATPase
MTLQQQQQPEEQSEQQQQQQQAQQPEDAPQQQPQEQQSEKQQEQGQQQQQQPEQQQQQDVQPAAVVAEVLARMEAGSIQRPRCAATTRAAIIRIIIMLPIQAIASAPNMRWCCMCVAVRSSTELMPCMDSTATAAAVRQRTSGCDPHTWLASSYCRNWLQGALKIL